MVPTYSSAWLELALAGLVTALVANRRLSATQEPALCATALAAASAGRTALLQATCEASASGWANLVRAALREPSAELLIVPEEAGYRDAPQRAPSETVTRVFAAELARARRNRAIGLAGAAAALLGAAMLLSAQNVPMGLMMLAALASVWRVIVNERRATAALDVARRALPDLVATLPPPPPPMALTVEPAAARIRVRTSWSALTAVFILGLGLTVVLALAGLIGEMTQRVPASQIGVLFGVHVMFVPLGLMLSMMLTVVDARVDHARREVVLVHRVLGITYARTIVPLEIVGSFFADKGGKGTTYLAFQLPTARPERRRRAPAPAPAPDVRLVTGNRAEEAAAELNRALGFAAPAKPS